MQVCRWEFLVFNGTFKTLLRVHEAPKDGKLVFSLIKSSFMKDFVGQWQVSCWRPASYTAALGRCGGKDVQMAPCILAQKNAFSKSLLVLSTRTGSSAPLWLPSVCSAAC